MKCFSWIVCFCFIFLLHLIWQLECIFFTLNASKEVPLPCWFRIIFWALMSLVFSLPEAYLNTACSSWCWACFVRTVCCGNLQGADPAGESNWWAHRRVLWHTVLTVVLLSECSVKWIHILLSSLVRIVKFFCCTELVGKWSVWMVCLQSANQVLRVITFREQKHYI